MRAVIQRVTSSSVSVEGKVVGEIGRGLMVLLGVGKGDGDAEAAWMAKKIAALRIFEDEAGKMNRSVLDLGGDGSVLAISQFTLYGDARKGNRPSFIDACEPEEAKRLYALFCTRLRECGLRVEEGIFAADMKVALVNDGPVTILLDTNA